LFNALDENSIRIVIDAMDLVSLMPGHRVITQGDEGDNLYIVEQGKLACSKLFVKKISYLNDEIISQEKSSQDF